MRVAALYVDPSGPYARMPDVDVWDAARDARLYGGPHPVVAHPPCGPWGKLKAFCRLQDRDLAPLAVAQVRRWGGIIEHPVGSSLFWASSGLGLPPAGGLPDAYGGVTIEVEQCRWGHRAEKRTLLYMVGVDRGSIVIPPWREPTAVVSSVRRGTEKVKLSSLEARLTPPGFARWLVDLASTVRRGDGQGTV